MKDVFSSSKWIWISEQDGEDEYGEFFSVFECDNVNLRINLSVDSDYALFINGKFVDSNQYGDFEHYKIYDVIDISKFVKKGKNMLAILGYHCGVSTSRYKKATAGVIFEIIDGLGNIIETSSSKVLCRKSKCYVSGRKSQISGQLGFNFTFNANFYDNWHVLGGQDFAPSVEVQKNCTFFARPIKKQKLLPVVFGKLIKSEKGRYLFDLGAETVGLPYLKLKSATEQNVTVAFGEHLESGAVMMTHGIHEFKYEYFAKIGQNEFTEYMLRIACRYLEVFCSNEIEIEEIGVIPQVYPVERKQFKFSGTDRQKQIYELCAKTLELCMMEHYVDCPWREQSLYAFDSRNQMLCGYYVFENFNADYVKANLKLIANDRREDGVLSICYPCGTDLAIPSFSLYYILAVEEYLRYTKDVVFIDEVFDKMKDVLLTFLNRIENGLVNRFGKIQYWDFYDWSDNLVGSLGQEEPCIPDATLNCLLIIALKRFKSICQACAKPFSFEEQLNGLLKSVKDNFFNKDKQAVSLVKDKEIYCALTNALAILSGVLDENEQIEVAKKLADGSFSNSSLSMKIFKYDALLKVDKQKYKSLVLQEISNDYGKMLDAGATSVWETVDGAKAFGGCGSLCHGWSAVPIYFYHILGLAE